MSWYELKRTCDAPTALDLVLEDAWLVFPLANASCGFSLSLPSRSFITWTGTSKARRSAGRSLWSQSVLRRRSSPRSGRVRRLSRGCVWWERCGPTGWPTPSGQRHTSLTCYCHRSELFIVSVWRHSTGCQWTLQNFKITVKQTYWPKQFYFTE